MSTRSEREAPDYKITEHDLQMISRGVFKRKKRQERNLRLLASGALQAHNPDNYPTAEELQAEKEKREERQAAHVHKPFRSSKRKTCSTEQPRS